MKGIIIRSWRNYIFIILLMPFAIAFSTTINVSLTDTFHEGEYVGFLWHMRDYYKGITAFPLFVHGGIDYIPSLCAAFIYGDDRIIVGTRIINALLVYVLWVLFLDLCYTLTPKSSRNTYWLLAIATVFIILAAPFNSHPLNLSQGFLGVRNFFLFLSVWGITKHYFSPKQYSSIIYLVLGASSTVPALFWCYDRGVTAAAFIVVIAMGMLVRKNIINFLVVTFSILLCLFLLEQTVLMGTVKENINNIAYWVRNSAEINTVPPHSMKYLLGCVGALTLVIFSAAAAYVSYLQKFTRDGEKESQWPLISGLLVIQLLTVKSILLNRADLDRSFSGCWPSILLMFYFGPNLFKLPELPSFSNYNSSRFKSNTISHLAYKVACTCLLSFLIFCSPPMLNYAIFSKMLVTSKPDAEIVSPEINMLSDTLNEINPECYFGWTNEGVIALMTKKRFCTDTPLLHYVARNSEAEVLRQLKRELPKAIVYNSPSWSMLINQHMSDRFPAINQFILANYPKKQSVGIFTVVLR